MLNIFVLSLESAKLPTLWWPIRMKSASTVMAILLS